MQAVNELPPGFLGQFEGGEEGLDYFLAKQVRIVCTVYLGSLSASRRLVWEATA